LKDIMKKTLLALALVSAFAATPAVTYAADTFSWNAAFTTDYRYRGISQSRLKPAFSVGADYALDSGFYVGTWLSTIKWIKDAGAGGSNLEWDIYGGYKGEFSKGGVGYDVGVLAYVYPGNKYGSVYFTSANTTELYGALTFGPATLKYSHSLTNLFGFAAPGTNSKGSGYLDLSATIDMGSGWSIVPHIGHQRVKGFSPASYTDYSITLNKDIDGLVLSAALVGTDAGKIGGVPVYPSPSGKDLGKNGIVFSIKKTF
jgi:uncharacterized protein (TIGR02001 family)